jgi:ABC-type lipoprotein export system ATPase subunit
LSTKYPALSTCNDESDASVFVLNGLNVDFMPGELNIIAGPTGCGKSSLLLALLGGRRINTIHYNYTHIYM